jgi:hypothetical protein
MSTLPVSTGPTRRRIAPAKPPITLDQFAFWFFFVTLFLAFAAMGWSLIGL